MLRLKVSGMTCDGCASAVKRAIGRVSSDAKVAVDLAGGEVGAGQFVKIMNNMILFQTGVALAEALALARRNGVDPALLFDTLTKGSADSFALRNHGLKAVLPGRFPLRSFSVRYAQKDLRYGLDLAEQVGIKVDAAHRVDHLFDAAVSAGMGDAYWPVISQLPDA